MRIIALVGLALLTACSFLKSPEEKYYALAASVSASAKVAAVYVTECKQELKSHPCYDNIPKIHDAAVRLDDSMTQTDKIFVTKDSDYYDLSITASENALAIMQKLLTE